MGRPEDHYKLLSWLCVAIARVNLDLRAFVELDGSGSSECLSRWVHH